MEAGNDLHKLLTEDGIAVRKLYVKCLVPTINVHEMKFLFSVYGEIEEIELIKTEGKLKNKNNYGFITLKECSVATKVLVNRKKLEEYFVIMPADSWHQPDFHKTSSNSPCTLDDPNLISTLNDDCLLKILSFLDLNEVMTFKNVCKKFEDVAEVHCKHQRTLDFSKIKSKNKLTLMDVKNILDHVGNHIQNLSISSDKFNNQRVLQLLPKHLKNVVSLKLTGFKSDKVFWRQMRNVLLKLESLDVSDNRNLNEDFLNCLKGKCLRKLNLSSSVLNGNCLRNLKSITDLNISECDNISGKNLKEFAKLNEGLKTLDISKCSNLYGNDVNDILVKLLQLETLSLNNYYIDEVNSGVSIPNLNKLVNLKHLHVHNIYYPPTDQLLKTINVENVIETLNISYGQLVQTSVNAIFTMRHLKKFVMNFKYSLPDDLVEYLLTMERLEEIHLAGCSNISSNNILRFIRLENLKLLDISRCYGFNNNFIFELIDILKENNFEKKLTIFVGGTEIDVNILEHPLVIEMEKVLEIKLTTTKDLEHDYDIDDENNNKAEVIPHEFFNIDGE